MRMRKTTAGMRRLGREDEQDEEKNADGDREKEEGGEDFGERLDDSGNGHRAVGRAGEGRIKGGQAKIAGEWLGEGCG